MKLLKQFAIILSISCIGELLSLWIPLPIPGSVYGLLLLLLLLCLHVIRLDQVKEAGEFLVEIMPVMFVPVCSGLITTWANLQAILLPFCIIVTVSTVVVLLATGKITDLLLGEGEDPDE